MRYALLLLLGLVAHCLTAQEKLIEIPPEVTKEMAEPSQAAGVYGTITSVGSDTLATLMALWAEDFQRIYPHVRIQIQATGSSTAAQALTQGTATIGPMSRALSARETNAFINKHGYPPTVLAVAIDAMAIFVEKNNPLTSISLAQIDALFSVTRYCGAPQSIERWQQLGVDKFGPDERIQLFGRNSASGTYDLFKKIALCGGDYKAHVNELPGSTPIILSVASSVGGLGYAAKGYANEDVKALKITETVNNGGRVIAPTSENIRAKVYPFSRDLYIVVNKQANQALPLLERRFLSFVLSERGQQIVADNGYYAIPTARIQRQLMSLQ